MLRFLLAFIITLIFLIFISELIAIIKYRMSSSQEQRKRLEKKERRRNTIWLIKCLRDQGIKSFDVLIGDDNGQLWLVEANKVDSIDILENTRYHTNKRG